ncbi:type III-B CRISPR module-associated protein Cmr3 [Desulfobaculum senezii]
MTDSRRFFSMEPVDSWFFRDGRPMHIDESALGSFKSLFPPFASTVTGCLRAAFARSKDWDGRSRWEKVWNKDLGDFNETGPLRFSGPHLCKGDELYFPVPQSLYFEGKVPCAMAWPSGEKYLTDLYERPISIPEMKPHNPAAKVRDDLYVSRDGLVKMLNGKHPAKDDVLPVSELWESESRIGIRRSAETLTTEENALYTTKHVRLRKDVSLVCGIEGLKDGYQAPSTPQPFGGEGRLASIEELKAEGIPASFNAGGDTLSQFALYVLTPLKLGGMTLTPESAVKTDKGPFTLKCAVTSKVLHVGGWANVRDEKGRAKYRKQTRSPLMIGGAVLFCKSETAALRVGDVVRIGDDTEFGFGVAVVGQWNAEGE